MNAAFKDYMEQVVVADHIHYEEPMSRHTTFRVGGNADCLIEISTVKELTQIIKYLRTIEIPYYVIGNGSNLLVSDKGYAGVILEIGRRMNTVEVNGDTVRAMAGALLSQVALEACGAELTGLEFAAGIPGCVGGAVVMNAGAYEREMQMVVEEVKLLNLDGEILTLDKNSMEYTYRGSAIKNRPFIVLEAVFRLAKGEKEQIQKKMDELNQKRHQKQPLEYPSAGSTFKRPEGHFAGKLIMDAGLRGYRIGGAQISEKHCGFIVNLGNACASDIYELIQEVQERVSDQFHITLEPELITLGDF